jgi:hypothetical protein
MTDHELLKDAAKAAGYKKYYAHYLGRDSFVTYDDEYYSEVKERRVVGEKTLDWNPLIDDGDALRLAVKLRLHAKHFSPYEDDFDIKPPGMVEVWQEDGEDPLHIEYFKPGDDPLAATRRAIVKAAAEIGRSMA